MRCHLHDKTSSCDGIRSINKQTCFEFFSSIVVRSVNMYTDSNVANRDNELLIKDVISCWRTLNLPLRLCDYGTIEHSAFSATPQLVYRTGQLFYYG
jgi:hypothetical protein